MLEIRAMLAAVFTWLPRVVRAGDLHLGHDAMPITVIFGIFLKVGIHGNGLVVPRVSVRLVVVAIIYIEDFSVSLNCLVKLAFLMISVHNIPPFRFFCLR